MYFSNLSSNNSNSYKPTLDDIKNKSFNELFGEGSGIVWGDQIIANQEKEHDKLIKKREKEEREKRELERLMSIRLARERLNKYISKYGNYWKHSQVDCYIPIDVRRVPSLDRANYLSIFIKDDGEFSIAETLVKSHREPMTKDEYLEKYCYLKKIDGEEKYVYYEHPGYLY